MPSTILTTFLSLLTIAAAHGGNNGRDPVQAPAAAAAVPKAIYFMTNDDLNAVVAVPVGEDGTLCGGFKTHTCGNGASSIDGSTNSTAAKDGLVSQSSLTVVDNFLFAVNAGSNTVSMFAIDCADPTRLSLIGEPAKVPGEFANTVAASSKNKLVCVGATGAVAGISCAPFDGETGVGKMDGLRPFDIKQSTPPVGPTNTLSQVFWSEDESKLFATVKGDPTKNNTGFLSAFSVETRSYKNTKTASALSTTDVKSSPNGTAVLFGSLPIPKTSNIFATDASFGGAILSVDETGQGSSLAAQPIDGQKATCWVAISEASKSAFVTDVATPRIVEMSLDDASILTEYDLSETGSGGLIDLKAAGNFVYALSPGSANTGTQVIVMDVSGGSKQAKLVQAFDTAVLGVPASAQGMAVLL